MRVGSTSAPGRGREGRDALGPAGTGGEGPSSSRPPTAAAIRPGFTLPGTAAYPGQFSANSLRWAMLNSGRSHRRCPFLGLRGRIPPGRLPSGQRGKSRRCQVRRPGAVAARGPASPPPGMGGGGRGRSYGGGRRETARDSRDGAHSPLGGKGGLKGQGARGQGVSTGGWSGLHTPPPSPA